MLNEQTHSFRDNPYSALLVHSARSSQAGLTDLSPRESLVYNDKDFEMATNIFQEALLQSSQKIPGEGSQSAQSSQRDSAKMDRMQLMKAYETILRSEGILPVTDSKIYNLVFKVFQKCEKTLHNDSQVSNQSKQSENNDILLDSLNEIKEKSQQIQKAIAYHEFRLQNKVFEAMRIILDMKISNDKENMHLKETPKVFGTQNRIYINDPASTIALGSRHQNEINLPRTIEIQTAKQGGVPVKHFSFKEDLNNNNSQQNIQSQITESHTHISAIQEQYPARNNSKVSLPPRDTKKAANLSGITSFAKHLNNNSSSDLNSQAGYMNINVHPSPSNESLAYPNQNLKPQIFQTQQQQRRHSNQHETNMTHRYPESTKHRPSATQHFIDPNQSSITQIPASSSGILSQSFTYYPIRQPRNSLQQDNLISDSSVSMFGGGGPTSAMKQEDDYVLLVKFMRKWQQGVGIIKREREQHRIMQENMYVAARYHAHSLLTKGLLAFIKYRIVINREREQLAICQSNVQNNIIRFYFKMFTNKYRERQWIKSGNNIATLFKSNQTLRKVLKAWSQQAKHQILKVNRIRKVFQRNIKPVQILIDMIGGFYTQQARYNQLDIDNFMRAAFNYWRVTERNKHVFNTMCVRLMTKRLRDIFNAWKYNIQKIILFKNRRLTWIAKKCFRALKLRADIKKQVAFKASKILFYLKFKAMLSLRQYTDSKILIKRKAVQVKKLHRNIVFKNFFGQWHHLFRYYSIMMKDSFVKDTLAKVIFLRKYLRGWQMVSQTHRYRRQALQLCARNQYERLISDCFYQLHQHANIQKRLKAKANKIQARHARSVREIFFVAWIRRSSLEYYARLVRDKSLKYKFITALQRNVAFRRILRQVEMISADHYSRTLLKSAWNALNFKRTRHIQLNNVKQVIYREYSLRLLSNCMHALIANRNIRQYKKTTDTNARIYFQTKLLEKTLYNLHIATVKSRVVSNAYNYITHQRTLKTKGQVISRMISKMNTRVSLRVRYESFVQAKALHLMRSAFNTLFNVYYDRMSKMNFLHSKCILTKQAQVFYNWFNVTNKQAIFKKKFQAIIMQRKEKLTEKVFEQLVLYTHQKKMKTYYNKISAFVFFQNLLKKYINIFKQNAIYNRNLRANYHITVLNRLKRVFNGFARVISLKKALANYIIKSSIALQERIFRSWRHEIVKAKSLKSKLSLFRAKREKRMHQMVFTQLHMVAHIGDNLMQQAFKRITHNKRKQLIIQLLKSWRLFTHKSQILNELYSQITSKRGSKQQSQILSLWKERAYYSHFERENLEPYINNKRIQTLTKVFNSLKHNVNNNENKLNRLNQASMYYISKILSNCFNAILKNAIHNQSNAQKLSNALSHNETRIVKNAWIMLYNYCVAKQRLHLGHKHISDNHQQLVKQTFMNKWIDHWNKNQRSKGAESILSQLYHKQLIQNVIDSFKEYTQYRQAKKLIIENLKPFKQQLQSIMQSQIKQRYLNYWIIKFNEAVQIKQQLSFQLKVQQVQELKNLRLMKTAFEIIKNQKMFNCRVVECFKNLEQIIFKLGQLQFFNLLFINSANYKKAYRIIQARIPKTQRKVLSILQIYKDKKKSKQQYLSFYRIKQRENTGISIFKFETTYQWPQIIECVFFQIKIVKDQIWEDQQGLQRSITVKRSNGSLVESYEITLLWQFICKVSQSLLKFYSKKMLQNFEKDLNQQVQVYLQPIRENRRGTNLIESYWRQLKLMMYRTYVTLGSAENVKGLVLKASWRLKNKNNRFQEDILNTLEFVSREELNSDSDQDN